MDGSRTMDDITPEENAEVQRMHDVILKAMDREIWQLAQFMVTRRDDQLFGATEFTLREKALRMGAQALEATVNDRKKRSTRGAVWSVPTAAGTRVSLGGGPARS